MAELATGAIVEITGRVVKGRTYDNYSTTIVEVSYSTPVKVIVLGKSQRHTGKLNHNGDYDYPNNYLTSIVSHPVWIVMPVDKNNHYRTPIAVLEKQVQE